MSDVGKGAGVNQDRGALQGLHQSRLDGVAHQHGHRPRHAQIVGRDRLARTAGGHHDLAQSAAHVGQVGCQGQDGHDLAGYRDVESGRAGKALGVTQADLDPAQKAVVGIHHPAPGDRVGVDIQAHEADALGRSHVIGIVGFDAEPGLAPQHAAGKRTLAVRADGKEMAVETIVILIALVQQARIDCCGKQVVGRRNGVDIPGQVQVESFHRDDLTVAAPGRPPLDSEGRPLARLADAGDGPAPQVSPQGLGQPDRGGGLPLPERSRGDGGHIDIDPVGFAGETIKHSERELGHVRTAKFVFAFFDTKFSGQFGDRPATRRTGDLDIGRNRIERFDRRGGKRTI